MPLFQCPPLPADTEHAANLTFRQDHPYLLIGNRLNSLLDGLQFSKAILGDEILFASFWPFSVLTILQYRENLNDHQLHAATCTRLDLKYALHLPLNFPGLPPMILCKFRQRLINNHAGGKVFQELIERIKLLVGPDNQYPVDTRQAVRAICTLNRLETILETLGSAIVTLETTHSEYLKSMTLQHWYSNYQGSTVSLTFRRSALEMEELLQVIGTDGGHLLDFIAASHDPDIESLPEIRALRQEWQRQFDRHQASCILRTQLCSWCNLVIKTSKEIIHEHSP